MIGAATQALGGLTSIASGIIGGGARREEQRKAQKELAINKARYENLDTSNLAANMENTYEDLTVNTQAADMAIQQQNIIIGEDKTIMVFILDYIVVNVMMTQRNIHIEKTTTLTQLMLEND